MKDTYISDIDFKNISKKLIMKPNKTIIYFSVVTGMGYGMIIVLSLLINTKLTSLSLNIKLFFSIISFFFIFSGLLISIICLGFQKKIWRVISQWKNSWTSREILFAIIAFIPLILFYFSWIIFKNEILTKIFLICSSLCAILTIYSTSKIYSSSKSIPEWNNPFVPILYILNGIVSGSLILFLIFYYFKIESYFLHNFIIIILPTTFFLKLLYWISIKKSKKNNFFSTSEIENKKDTKLFTRSQTGTDKFNTEMLNYIDKNKSFSYRGSCIILTYITPVYCMLQTPSLVVNYEVSVITYAISTFLSISGMFIERWLFFIESKHAENQYYGKNAF